jgi:hypothetical protein
MARVGRFRKSNDLDCRGGIKNVIIPVGIERYLSWMSSLSRREDL